MKIQDILATVSEFYGVRFSLDAPDGKSHRIVFRTPANKVLMSISLIRHGDSDEYSTFGTSGPDDLINGIR